MQSGDAMSSQIVHLPTRLYGHKMPPLWWGNGFAYKDMCVLSVVKTWTMFTGHLIFTPSRALYVTLARANTMQLKAANVTHAAHVTNAISMMEHPNIPRRLC